MWGQHLTEFVGLNIIYIAFGIINPRFFQEQKCVTLCCVPGPKYLLIGNLHKVYVLITETLTCQTIQWRNDAMIAATLMTQEWHHSPCNCYRALIACLVSWCK